MKGREGGAVARIRRRGRIGGGGLIMIEGRRMRGPMREEEEVEGKKVKRGSEGKMEGRRKREKEKEGIRCWRNKERGKEMREEERQVESKVR